MTGYTDPEIVKVEMVNNKMPFMLKPFSPATLAKNVHAAMAGDKEA